MKYTVEGEAKIMTDGEPFGSSDNQKSHVICDVCGHANKVTAALCSECSNYLFGERKEYVLEK